jgi:hypothetical protein
MLSEPRTIYVQTELRWLPIEGFGISKDGIRAIYNRLHERKQHSYENLDLQADTPTLSTRHEKGFSQCQIGSDGITIEEKRTEFTIDEFIAIVKAVLDALGDECPPLFAQLCKIQCLTQPHERGDSLSLLAGEVANVISCIDPFERPPSFFGVRFRFMPEFLLEDAEENEEVEEGEPAPSLPGDAELELREGSEAFVNVRFETFAEDMSLIWMEATASFAPQPIDASKVAKNILEVYEFLAVKCKAFLDQFDKPRTETNE